MKLRALVLLAFFPACSQRSCDRSSTTVTAPDASRDAPMVDRERCRAEVAHASVATPPGIGPIEVLMPTCGGSSLAVWALRGHTLSRFERPLAPGNTFSVPEVIATGADRLGPVAVDAFEGPVAWRSPTLGMDPAEGDEWWVGWLDHDAIPGSRTRIGSAVLAPGATGLGIIAPIARNEHGVEVLTTVARAGHNPQLVRHTVPAPTNTVESLAEDPVSLVDGELKAWESSGRTALVFALVEGGDAVLRAMDLTGEPRVAGTVPLEHEHLLVHPRGWRLDGATWFAYSEFDVGRHGQGACLELDPSLCVRPAAVTILRVDSHGVSTLAVAPAGLVDTFAPDGHGGLLVMYIAPGDNGAQRAARVDLASRAVRDVALTPSDDVPPVDHPTLVACGGEPWLVAEVLVREAGSGSDGGSDGESARATPQETAVIALPFACIGR